jgi:hypothetical protein
MFAQSRLNHSSYIQKVHMVPKITVNEKSIATLALVLLIKNSLPKAM